MPQKLFNLCPCLVISLNVTRTHLVVQFQYLTIMSVELHCRNRGDLRPDPQSDEICAIFYSILNDVPPDKGERDINGVLIADPVSASQMAKRKQQNPK